MIHTNFDVILSYCTSHTVMYLLLHQSWQIYAYIYLLMCWQRLKIDKLKIRWIKSSLLPDTAMSTGQQQPRELETEREATVCLEMKNTIHSGFRNWHITLKTSLGIILSVTVAQFVNNFLRNWVCCNGWFVLKCRDKGSTKYHWAYECDVCCTVSSLKTKVQCMQWFRPIQL